MRKSALENDCNGQNHTETEFRIYTYGKTQNPRENNWALYKTFPERKKAYLNAKALHKSGKYSRIEIMQTCPAGSTYCPVNKIVKTFGTTAKSKRKSGLFSFFGFL